MSDRVRNAAWWLLPVVFLVWLYRDGFFIWFVNDDFAWLSLLRLVHTRHDLLHEMFTPMAQGTIRPWSERGIFILLEGLFGLDSLPFRIVTFATAAADILLIAWLTLRITGSRVAGFVAPVLWTANSALALVMTWSSAYNEVMCTLFLVSALALFIRYTETGERKFWWWQLVVFSLGFGALEINIVYPALAAAWVIFAGKTPVRAGLRSLAPAAGISTVYFFIHRWAAPLPTSGPYVMSFDASIFKSMAFYWKWSLTPQAMKDFGHSNRAVVFVVALLTLAIAGFVIAELRHRRYLVLFFLAWFVIPLVPLLPLASHRTDYYLTIPLIGLAMLGGTAAGEYWNAPLTQRALVVLPIAAYLWAMIPVTRGVTHWWRQKTQAVRTLVLGVNAARETHPGKAIVIKGVNSELFALSLAHSPFYATGVNDVYLAPESALSPPAGPGMVDPATLILDPAVLWHGITHNEVVVYSLESDHLRNITEGYTRLMAANEGSTRPITARTADRLPTHVDVGNILYSWLLGPTWLPPESGIRWMPASATLRIGVPPGGSQLELNGRCPRAQLLVAPRHLMVLVDGVIAGDTRIYDPESDFHRLFPMSGVLAGKTSVEVEIRVDPVDRKDDQAYGLVFGEIAVRP